MNLFTRDACVLTRHLNVKPRRVVTTNGVLKTNNIQSFTNALMVNVERFNVGQGNLTSQRVRSRVQTRHAPVNVHSRRLNIRVSVFRRSNKLSGILRLNLTPHTARLIITRHNKRKANFLIRANLLVIRPLRLNSRYTRFPLTTLFSLHSLILRNVGVLNR